MKSPRRAAVLILVAGVTALLAALAVSFLARMRTDSDECVLVERMTQARIMLVAACSYVQEASRLGYDDGRDPVKHQEAFGWIDVRDGSVGPCGIDRRPFWSARLAEDGDGDGRPDRPAWPAIGGVARCPMHVMRRPPFAVQMTTVYNPLDTDPGAPDFCVPYLRHADPQPVAATLADFIAGDPRPRTESSGSSWFRAYRDGPATFVLTCGAGGTLGFRDWSEVVGARAEASFQDDPELFAQLATQEVRLWYRIEWTAAVQSSETHLINCVLNNDDPNDHYVSFPPNTSDVTQAGGMRSQSSFRNFVGSLRWVERLPSAPSRW